MKIGISIFFLALIISSCEKDEYKKPILAGILDSGMLFYEFNPALHVNHKSDSLLNYRYGTDSMDLNLDGKFDLIISQRFFIDWNSSNQINDRNYPFCKLTLRNSLEVVKKTEIYYIGLGQTSSVDWVDALLFEKRIENSTEWSGTNINIWMWVIPPTVFWGSYGSWYTLVDMERYVGIRMKIDSTYKNGWIKINQINRENLVFICFAIEK
jgi:hypothetical protein